MEIRTMFSVYGDIFLETSKYVADNSIYIEAYNIEDGPIATLTVCLNDKSLGEDETYLDTNNCPWVLDFVEEYGLATPTGEYRRSGYCIYPKVKVNMENVRKYS